jgi:hypothetical protein
VASGDGQLRGAGLVEADQVGIEEATVQVERAVQDRRFEVQRPADPDPAQADPSRIYRPVLADQQMPEHPRMHGPLWTPGLHLGKAERATAAVNQLSRCSACHHFLFQQC